MRKSLFASAVAVLALSFGVAACGSDDSSDTPDENTLTKTELIAQADALCQEFDGQVEAKATEAFGSLQEQPTTEELSTFLSDEVIPMYKDQIGQLRELQPDEESSDDWNNVVDTFESELNDVEADPDAAATSDESPFAEANAAANEFGLEVCGAS